MADCGSEKILKLFALIPKNNIIVFLPLASPLSLHPLTNFKLYHWTLLKEKKSK